MTFSAIPADATGIAQWSRGQLVGDPGCAKCLKKFKPNQVIVEIANLKGKGSNYLVRFEHPCKKWLWDFFALE